VQRFGACFPGTLNAVITMTSINIGVFITIIPNVKEVCLRRWGVSGLHESSDPNFDKVLYVGEYSPFPSMSVN
jgi:hypothetical protein